MPPSTDISVIFLKSRLPPLPPFSSYILQEDFDLLLSRIVNEDVVEVLEAGLCLLTTLPPAFLASTTFSGAISIVQSECDVGGKTAAQQVFSLFLRWAEHHASAGVRGAAVECLGWSLKGMENSQASLEYVRLWLSCMEEKMKEQDSAREAQLHIAVSFKLGGCSVLWAGIKRNNFKKELQEAKFSFSSKSAMSSLLLRALHLLLRLLSDEYDDVQWLARDIVALLIEEDGSRISIFKAVEQCMNLAAQVCTGSRQTFFEWCAEYLLHMDDSGKENDQKETEGKVGWNQGVVDEEKDHSEERLTTEKNRKRVFHARQFALRDNVHATQVALLLLLRSEHWLHNTDANEEQTSLNTGFASPLCAAERILVTLRSFVDYLVSLTELRTDNQALLHLRCKVLEDLAVNELYSALSLAFAYTTLSPSSATSKQSKLDWLSEVQQCIHSLKEMSALMPPLLVQALHDCELVLSAQVVCQASDSKFWARFMVY